MQVKNAFLGSLVVAVAVGLAVLRTGVELSAPGTDEARTPPARGWVAAPARTTPSDDAPLIVPPTPELEPAGSAVPVTDAPVERGMDLDYLMALDPESLRHLVATADPDVAQAAAWQMGNRLSLADDDVETLLARLEASSAADVALRKTILWALSLRPDLLPLATVAEFALSDPAPEIRRTAIRTLSTIRQPLVAETLYRSATGDSSPQNRSESATYLTLHLDAERAAQIVDATFAAEINPEVRESWVNVLGSHPSDANVAALEQILHDSSESEAVRQASAEMLIESGSLSLAEVLASPSLGDTAKQQLQAMYAPRRVSSEDPS